MVRAIETVADENSAFSRQLPGLQIAIDSTSLGEFKTCARKYYYSIIRGLRPRSESVHLTFGLLMHGAIEQYAHARTQGVEHQTAVENTVHWCLRQTWNSALRRPWISDHPAKNRLSLVRSVVWYLEQFGWNDPLETLVLENGKPAVELTFAYDSGITAEATGEQFVFSGHLDRIAKLNDVPYVVDIKTTVGALGPRFFSGFTPGNQFSMYALASKVAFATPVDGLIVDGVQVGATFARFERALVPRSDSFLAEWLEDTRSWLGQLERAALAQHWPMNDKSCSMYGGCVFQQICGRAPGAREQWLQSEYVKRVWNPLDKRGDI